MNPDQIMNFVFYLFRSKFEANISFQKIRFFDKINEFLFLSNKNNGNVIAANRAVAPFTPARTFL